MDIILSTIVASILGLIVFLVHSYFLNQYLRTKNNLALALHHKGFDITGSDDAIFSPSKERLEKFNLLPAEMGWFPSKITSDLNAVILGMHAKEDNPELKKAIELNIPIFSYPEYIYEQSKNKKRIVIGGSHGKTSITAMILHVLKNLSIDF